MLTFPAFSLPLVSLSILTLLRLRSLELMMETGPDWPRVFPVSICILLSGNSIITCLLVIMDELLSRRFPCGLLCIVTFPDLEWEDSVSISVLLRLLVVMLTSPPFPELFLPSENVKILSSSALFLSALFLLVDSGGGGLNFIVFASSFMAPPFLELLLSELETE